MLEESGVCGLVEGVTCQRAVIAQALILENSLFMEMGQNPKSVYGAD